MKKISFFYFICPKCGKVLFSENYNQLSYNAKEHIARHGLLEEKISIKWRQIEVE